MTDMTGRPAGILVCFLVGTYLRWDHLALFAGCIPVPFLIMMWFVPETPRWYVTRGESLTCERTRATSVCTGTGVSNTPWCNLRGSITLAVSTS